MNYYNKYLKYKKKYINLKTNFNHIIKLYDKQLILNGGNYRHEENPLIVLVDTCISSVDSIMQTISDNRNTKTCKLDTCDGGTNNDKITCTEELLINKRETCINNLFNRVVESIQIQINNIIKQIEYDDEYMTKKYTFTLPYSNIYNVSNTSNIISNVTFNNIFDYMKYFTQSNNEYIKKYMEKQKKNK